MFDWLDVYPWALPVAIFFGRICDVSLGTLRIIFVARGEKKLAPVIGFFEVFIWVVIIAQVLSRANELVSFIAYAGGYATGTLVGLLIEQQIGFGFVTYRVFTTRNGPGLAGVLNQRGYGATVIHGQGAVAEIDIVEAVVGRKDVKSVERIISQFDPSAFYVVEDVRTKQRGIFTTKRLLAKKK